MPSFRTGAVVALLEERRGLQRCEVAFDGGQAERAYVLTELTGPVAVGDEVVLNTTAVELGLGSGGWHLVHWNLSRRKWRSPGPGQTMKLRYTSLQADVGSAEELHAGAVAESDDLDGVPVVVCGLHSQLALRRRRRQARSTRPPAGLHHDRRRRTGVGRLRPGGGHPGSRPGRRERDRRARLWRRSRGAQRGVGPGGGPQGRRCRGHRGGDGPGVGGDRDPTGLHRPGGGAGPRRR